MDGPICALPGSSELEEEGIAIPPVREYRYETEIVTAYSHFAELTNKLAVRLETRGVEHTGIDSGKIS